MHITTKKYDEITHENASELELVRLQSELHLTDDVWLDLQSGNPDASRDGDTECHIWAIELQVQATQFIIRHTHLN